MTSCNFIGTSCSSWLQKRQNYSVKYLTIDNFVLIFWNTLLTLFMNKFVHVNRCTTERSNHCRWFIWIYLYKQCRYLPVIAPLVLGPVYGSLDVEAADVTVATAFDATPDDGATGDNIAGVEHCDDFATVCRLITISVGISTVIGVSVAVDVLVVSVVTGSKQTSSRVVPDAVCSPAISFKSIQLAPTLSLSVRGKLRTRVSFSSTMWKACVGSIFTIIGWLDITCGCCCCRCCWLGESSSSSSRSWVSIWIALLGITSVASPADDDEEGDDEATATAFDVKVADDEDNVG